MVFEKMVLSPFKRVCRIHFMTKLCTHFSMLAQIAWLRVDSSKSVTVRSWHIVRPKKTKVPIVLNGGIRLKTFGGKDHSSELFFAETPNFSTATKKIRSPKQ